MTIFCCSDETRQTISLNFLKFKRKRLSAEGLKQAAVTITVMDYRRDGNLSGLKAAASNEAALLLTRRATGLTSHAGQWALPGGRLDHGESPIEAALRELREEVGIFLTKGRLIGYLDDFVTRSGYHITPVVVWAGEVATLHVNRAEVASVHRIPFRELFRSDSPVLEQGVEHRRPILYVPIGSTWVATPTAAILYQFREVALCGTAVRVEHFDQPYFAWK